MKKTMPHSERRGITCPADNWSAVGSSAIDWSSSVCGDSPSTILNSATHLGAAAILSSSAITRWNTGGAKLLSSCEPCTCWRSASTTCLAKNICLGALNKWSTLHGALVHSNDLLHYRLLNDLHRLHNMLDVLNPLHNFVGHLNMLDHFSYNYLLHRVWLLHVYNLLHGHGNMLDLLARHLARNRHLNAFFDNLLNRNRNIPVTNLLHRDLHFIWLRHSDFIWLRDLTVHIPNNFFCHRARDRAINKLLHFIRHTDLLAYLNTVRDFNTPLNNLLDRVRLGNLHNLVHWVWFVAVHKLLHRVWHSDFLTAFDLNRNINSTLDDFLHWVGDRTIHTFRHGIGAALLHDLLHRVRDLAINNLLNRVGDLNMLHHSFVHRDRDLDNLFANLLNWDRDINSADDLLWAGDIHSANDFMGNRNFNTHGDWHLALTLHNLFIWPVNGNLDASLNNLFDWYRNTPFHNLLHRIRAWHTFNTRNIVGPLNSLLDNLLDRVWATNFDDLLDRCWDRDIHPLVHWVGNLHRAWLRARHIVGLGHVHSAHNFLRTRNIHSADLLNLLHHINKPSLLGKVGQRTGVLRHRCAGEKK